MGRIITFYSYKGGSGRSMALANVAWALSTNGANVLAIDWDLEAPGLHRYFHPFLKDPELTESAGLIDRLWDYAIDKAQSAKRSVDDWANFSSLALELNLPSGAQGRLAFIGAGRQDDDYSRKVMGFDWSAFYERLAGADFFDRFATWARNAYDFILIDSRTGVSDSAGVCTVQLPDTVVLTFVYNRQSIEGTAAVARSILAARRGRGEKTRIVPVPTRVEDRQGATQARRHAASELHGLLGMDQEEAYRELRIAEVRHHSWCALEEKLAVFEEEPDERGTLLADMHALASRLGRQVKPIHFDSSELGRFWRRAAFSDPRLADLKTLSSTEPADALGVLADWLADADRNDGDRVDWLAALAQYSVEAPQIYRDPGLVGQADEIAAHGIFLAHQIAARKGASYSRELGRLLLLRANQLQANGLLHEALATVDEARSLFQNYEGPEVLLLARAFEWQARTMAVVDDKAADRLLIEAATTYMRAAGSDPKHYADAARVYQRLCASFGERGQGALATEFKSFADNLLMKGLEAGAVISPENTTAELLTTARLALHRYNGNAATRAVQEAVESAAHLDQGPTAKRLKQDAATLWRDNRPAELTKDRELVSPFPSANDVDSYSEDMRRIGDALQQTAGEDRERRALLQLLGLSASLHAQSSTTATRVTAAKEVKAALASNPKIARFLDPGTMDEVNILAAKPAVPTAYEEDQGQL